jgi:hypothetical protein
VSKNRFVFGRVDDKVTLIATPVWAGRLSVHDHVHVCLLWFRLDHVGYVRFVTDESPLADGNLQEFANKTAARRWSHV